MLNPEEPFEEGGAAPSYKAYAQTSSICGTFPLVSVQAHIVQCCIQYKFLCAGRSGMDGAAGEQGCPAPSLGAQKM
jgi:hypothetical protein